MQLNNKILNLFNVFLKLDFRDKENSGKKKLIGIVISYLIANTFLSLNNYHSFDKFGFSFFSFSTGVFLLAFIVLNDFSNLFFSKAHTEILNSLPIGEKNIASAKFLSAFFYLSFFVFVIILPQSIFFYLYKTGIFETIQFLFLNIIFIYLITGVIILVYALAVFMFDKRASVFIYIIQFVFFVVIMYSSNMTSRATMTEKYNIEGIKYINLFPQYYFAKNLTDITFLVAVFFLMVLVYSLLYLFISRNYNSMSERVFTVGSSVFPKRTLGTRGGVMGLFPKRTLGTGGGVMSAGSLPSFQKSPFGTDTIRKFFLKNNNELAGYMLIKNQMKNSRPLKAKFLPITFIPLIIAFLAMFSGVPGLLIFESRDFIGLSEIKILSPSITLTLIMCLRLLISNTKISEENTEDIKWLYDSIPIINKKSLIKGVNKYIYINFIFPVLIILFLILCFKFPLMSLVLNLLYILSMSVLINSVYLIFDKTLPFTVNSSKHNSVSKLGEIFLTIILGVIIFAVQIFTFENIIFILISLFLISGVSIVINKSLTPKIKLN